METSHNATDFQRSGPGVTFYGYRWYDPENGRWPSRDPIQERGGINLYLIVENASVNFIDNLGLAGGFPNPELPIRFPGRLVGAYRETLYLRTQMIGQPCCCLYSSDVNLKRIPEEMVDLRGKRNPGHYFRNFVYVKKPDGGCDTLARAIQIRILIAINPSEQQFHIIEFRNGTKIMSMPERRNLFDGCNIDNLVVTNEQAILERLLDDLINNSNSERQDPWNPGDEINGDNDFGDSWKPF